MPAQQKTILYKSKAYLCETSWVVIHTNMLTYMLYLILNHTLYTLSVIYVICCVVGAWMQTFLCHLFSLGLILPQSLSFHTPVHFSSLPLNAVISQPASDGGARVFKPQQQQPFNLRFPVCSCARKSAPQHNSRSSSRFPSATCSTSLLWPQHPILCVVTQMKSSRAHSGPQLGRGMKENEAHLMFSPGWSRCYFLITVYLLMLFWPPTTGCVYILS